MWVRPAEATSHAQDTATALAVVEMPVRGLVGSVVVAAAEAAIGLAILVVFFRNRGSIAVEDANVMKG